MARIAGVDLPRNKRIDIALTYIFGIGNTSSRKILEEAQIDPAQKSERLTDEEISRIRAILDQTYKVEGDLRREITLHVKRLTDLGSYRGLRHRRNLPARGQRTHTNARTRKGPRRAIAGKKSAPKPK